MSGDGDRIEQQSDTAFFTYGRFNPPTIGHKLLVDRVVEFSKGRGNQGEEEKTGDAYAFVTSTQDRDSNPLSVDEKVEILKLMYPDDTQVRIINTTKRECRTIPQVVGKLQDAGYEHLTMIVGSDRVDAFAGKFRNVKVVSAGQRDMDADEGEEDEDEYYKENAGPVNIAKVAAKKVRKLARLAMTLEKSDPRKAILLEKVRRRINDKVSDAKVTQMITTIQSRWNQPGAKSAKKRGAAAGAAAAAANGSASTRRRPNNGNNGGNANNRGRRSSARRRKPANE